MKNNFRILGIIRFFSLLITGCSSTKYLKEDEILYTGGEVAITDELITKSERQEMEASLEELLRPIPNASFLGLKPKLLFYNLGGDPKKQSALRRWFRNKLGQAPVLYDQVDMEHNRAIISNRLENEGYFNVAVTSDTIVKSEQKKGALYKVIPGAQYKIDQVTFRNDSTPLQQLLRQAGRRSRLRKGRPYNLESIKNERVRLDGYVKNKGYYYFSPEDILVQVDSTVGDHQVDLYVKIKESAPKLALAPYTIDNIYVFSDYKLSDINFKQAIDSGYSYKDFTVIDPNNRFKPSIYDQTIHFKKGDLYTRDKHNSSLNRLVNLGVFKFVKNQFEIADTLNNTLDVYYFLTPDNPKAIRVELLGKNNSASYTGAELNLNWSNKNVFRGAEVLSISAYGGADFQMSSKNKGYDVYKVGMEANLTLPRLLTPWTINSASGYIPKTRLTVGGEYLERTKLYALNSFKASWGYFWNQDNKKEHKLNVLEVNYVSPKNVTAQYEEDAKGNPSLERVLDKQLIFGPTYTYTFTNTMNQYKRNTIYYRGGLDLSANLTGLLMGADFSDGKEKKILGVPFSQYVKTEHDFRYYRRLGRGSQLVSRIHAGVGIAYGNSRAMPYTKQFFIGGSNSVRAFKARALGPGSYDPDSAKLNYIPDQSGDMLIEFNLEYRKKLFSIVHGALFIDGGNIWNLREVSDRPGGKISSSFYKEIALGAGAGLRFDVTFLVLRFDLAFPLRVPYNQPGERWVIDDIKFGSGRWRKDNLMLNFAIGYPF